MHLTLCNDALGCYAYTDWLRDQGLDQEADYLMEILVQGESGYGGNSWAYGDSNGRGDGDGNSWAYGDGDGWGDGYGNIYGYGNGNGDNREGV